MTKWNYCPECGIELVIKDDLPTCPQDHFTKYTTPVASTIGFIRNNDEYLILRRTRDPQKGVWDLPGGFTQHDENSFETLIREIDEETGITNLLNPLFLGTFPSIYGESERTLAIAYVFDCPSRDVILSEENDAHKWVSLDKMPELAFKDCQDALELLRQKMV